MNIDLLQSVMKKAELEIVRKSLTCKKYYYFEGKWHDLHGKKEATQKETDNLESSKNVESFYSHIDKTAWYFIEEHLAAIAIIFKSAVRAPRRKEYRELINSIVENATNAYNVSHNALTGLYSRKHFHTLVRKNIESFESNLGAQTATASEGEGLFSISLIAFDIDKFKQVNDTYGHLYGDQVLKAFSMRLQEVKEQLQKSFENKIEIELAHPSGEEFFALVVGQTSEENIRSIADMFRKGIADTSLPNDLELKKLNIKTEENGVIPPLQERKITTSVGVASYVGHQMGSTSEGDTLALFDKADTALYRSKAGGRDRVTLSQEILKKCGRVLEHNQTTGVVVLDIGKDVGVLVGQEFKVFPPMFSGNFPYIDDDGRSKRTLGVYPKVEIGRVVVFNSQEEISFAVVSSANKSPINNIDKGSLLEAVPLGHITHLLENPQGGFNFGTEGTSLSILGGKELREYLQQLESNTQKAYSAVFRFKNESEFLQKYGSAALNKALAQLYSDVRQIFGYNVRVGVIDKTSVCVVCEATADYEEQANKVLSTRDIDKDGLEIICGYYTPPANENNDLIEVLPTHALELAKFTASNFNSFKDKKINRFSVKLAETYIGEQRVSQNYESAIADYKRFKEMGIIDASIENHIGLCFYMMKDIPSALECFARAINLAPDRIIFRSNFATMAMQINEVEKGLECLSKLSDANVEKLKTMHPYGFVVYALLLEKGSHIPSSFYNQEKFIKIASDAIKMKEAQSRSDFSILQQAVINASS